MFCVVKFLVVLLTAHVFLFFSNQLLSHKRHLIYLGQTVESKSTSTSSVIKKEKDSLEAFKLIHRYCKIIKRSESNYLGILMKRQNMGMFVLDCTCVALSTLKWKQTSSVSSSWGKWPIHSKVRRIGSRKCVGISPITRIIRKVVQVLEKRWQRDRLKWPSLRYF